MTPAELLARLAQARAERAVGPLPLAFARFAHELEPAAPASLLAAAALVVHLEGQGHSGLSLSEPALAMAGTAGATRATGATDKTGATRATGDQAAGMPNDGSAPGSLASLLSLLSLLPASPGAARAAWQGLALVQIEPADERGSSPLVLAQGRLCLRRYWRCERRIVAEVAARVHPWSAEVAGGVQAAGDRHASARALLEDLFAPQGQRHSEPHAAPPAASQHERKRMTKGKVPWAEMAAPAALGTATSPPDDAGPNWQKVACALALRGGLTIVTGGPGTGKTYTAARALALLLALHGGQQGQERQERPAGHARSERHEPLRVALAAPTGKAASRLRGAIEQAWRHLPAAVQGRWPVQEWLARLPPARTLHALLGARSGTRRLAHDAGHPLDVDVVIVDEASMIHLEQMAALLEALPRRARLVLLGDKDQLASVEAGAVLGDLCQAAAGIGYDPATQRWLHQVAGVQVAEEVPERVREGMAEALKAAGASPTSGPASALAQQVATLRTSHRFAGTIGALAQAVNAGEGDAVLALLQGANPAEARLLVQPTPQAVATAAAEGYAAYLKALAAGPADLFGFDAWARQVLECFDTFRVLCAVREGPWGVAELNGAIAAELASAGLLPKAAVRRSTAGGGAASGAIAWYEGRPVIVTRNDPALRLFNGDIGIALRPAGGGELRVCFAGGDDGTAAVGAQQAMPLRTVAVGRLADVETAFALTVHKSQGSEFGHVLLALPEHDGPVLTRELLYTGITRARQRLTVVTNEPARLLQAVQRRTLRSGGLAAMLGASGASGAGGATPLYHRAP